MYFHKMNPPLKKKLNMRLKKAIHIFLKGEFVNSFIGVSDAPKNDITWTENGGVNYHFIQEILTFEDINISGMSDQSHRRL